MHFADLEGIEEIPVRDAEAVREEIERQFHRNVYEAFYALEALALEVDRRWRILREAAARRRWILETMERACAADPHVAFERRGERLVLVVETAIDADSRGGEIQLASEAWTQLDTGRAPVL